MGLCIWLAGMPGSGKTTIAYQLQDCLQEQGYKPVVLDGNDVKQWLTPQMDYSRTDRIRGMIVVATIAQYIVRAGGTVIVSLTSPYKSIREQCKVAIGWSQTYMVGLGVTEKAADRRGKKWDAGESYGTPETYESPGLEVDDYILTDDISAERAVDRIIDGLAKKNLIERQ